MLDLAEQVIALTGSNSQIVHKPLPQDDPKQRRPDISQANQMLNWTPKIPLVKGLEKTIDYFRNIV
jgi:UDP-glucuronate decarboxylase